MPKFLCPMGVPPEPPDAIIASKALVHGDHVEKRPVVANDRTGRVGFQILHHCLCEF